MGEIKKKAFIKLAYVDPWTLLILSAMLERKGCPHALEPGDLGICWCSHR